MKAKTSPGASYVVPEAKVSAVILNPDYDVYSFILEVDASEEALITASAHEVVAETFPGFDGDVILPFRTSKGRITFLASGKFMPVIRDAKGEALPTVRSGAIVSMRVMLKAHRGTEGVMIAAFPSRIDVKRATRGRPKKDTIQAPELPLVPPIAAVTAPKPVKAPKPKAAPKPKTPTPFDKAAFARHRAEVVEARARLKARKSKPIVPETAPALPSNVISFPKKYIVR